MHISIKCFLIAATSLKELSGERRMLGVVLWWRKDKTKSQFYTIKQCSNNVTTCGHHLGGVFDEHFLLCSLTDVLISLWLTYYGGKKWPNLRRFHMTIWNVMVYSERNRCPQDAERSPVPFSVLTAQSQRLRSCSDTNWMQTSTIKAFNRGGCAWQRCTV